MSPLAGRFTYRPATDFWTWSDGMYRIHGYEPGEVDPSTPLVMRHMHPDDVEGAWNTRDTALEEARPIVFPHRIHAADGQVRVVIAAGHVQEDEEGLLMTGLLIEVPEREGVEAFQPYVEQVVEDFSEHRSAIEQAKGVLMQLLSIDATTAWETLRAYAEHARRPVRAIAESLVTAAITDETPAKQGPNQGVFGTLDHLLLGHRHGK